MKTKKYFSTKKLFFSKYNSNDLYHSFVTFINAILQFSKIDVLRVDSVLKILFFFCCYCFPDDCITTSDSPFSAMVLV